MDKKSVLCPSIVMRRERCSLQDCPFLLHDESKTRVYVYPLPTNTSKETLLELFSSFGYIYKTIVKSGNKEQPNQDIGFVHFCSDVDAQHAIRAMNRTRPNGFSEVINCRLADSNRRQRHQSFRSRSPRSISHHSRRSYQSSRYRTRSPSPPPSNYHQCYTPTFPQMTGDIKHEATLLALTRELKQFFF